MRNIYLSNGVCRGPTQQKPQQLPRRRCRKCTPHSRLEGEVQGQTSWTWAGKLKAGGKIVSDSGAN